MNDSKPQEQREAVTDTLKEQIALEDKQLLSARIALIQLSMAETTECSQSTVNKKKELESQIRARELKMQYLLRVSLLEEIKSLNSLFAQQNGYTARAADLKKEGEPNPEGSLAVVSAEECKKQLEAMRKNSKEIESLLYTKYSLCNAQASLTQLPKPDDSPAPAAAPEIDEPEQGLGLSGQGRLDADSPVFGLEDTEGETTPREDGEKLGRGQREQRNFQKDRVDCLSTPPRRREILEMAQEAPREAAHSR